MKYGSAYGVSKIIREKLEMLDALKDMEIATSLLKEERHDRSEGVEDQDPVDLHYRKLRTRLDVVDRDSVSYLRHIYESAFNNYRFVIGGIQADRKMYYNNARTNAHRLYFGGPGCVQGGAGRRG